MYSDLICIVIYESLLVDFNVSCNRHLFLFYQTLSSLVFFLMHDTLFQYKSSSCYHLPFCLVLFYTGFSYLVYLFSSPLSYLFILFIQCTTSYSCCHMYLQCTTSYYHMISCPTLISLVIPSSVYFSVPHHILREL